jgi:LuxR family transcriptional regulator, maltose regulon positive regulatory protein
MTDVVPQLPLLATKLAVPRTGRSLVVRPELYARLDAGRTRGVVVVTAPPGFGKTTLLAAWLAMLAPRHKAQGNQESLQAAWLSLDANDNDLARFLAYVVAALQQFVPTIGTTTLALLRAPQEVPALETLLTPLVNDLALLEHEAVLVLDDYHLIAAVPVHAALEFLLDHRPPQLTLVIASRSTPPLPLARLRARGGLIELGAADLRLTQEQVGSFVREVMGIELSADAVALLDARTEGWVAGMQLAALALEARAHERGSDSAAPDLAAFLQTFGGGHRYVFDYLSDEVLRRQEAEVQRFLLASAPLDRLCAPLCAAVLGDGANEQAAQAMLERLEAANLFLVPLDAERRWYRYHQLFADVLRARLQRTQPELLPSLHQRASSWYAANGFVEEAVGHAVAASDWTYAAELVEQVAHRLLVRSETTTLLRWLYELPAAVREARPQLLLVHAWALLATGQFDAVAPLLGQPALDEERLSPALRGELLAVRATLAGLHRDQPDDTIVLAQQAQHYLSEEQRDVRGVLAIMLGAAYYQRDEIAAAYEAFAEARAISVASHNVIGALFALRQLADIETMRGRLHAAEAFYREAIQLASERFASGDNPALGTAYIGLGELALEHYQLAEAVLLAQRGIALGEHAASVEIALKGYVVLALAQQALGDDAAAAATQEQALRAARATTVPLLMSWMQQAQARLWLLQGDVAAAARWADDQEIRFDSELVPLRWVDYTTLARLYLAQAEGPSDPLLIHAAELLARLCAAAEKAGRTGSAIEVLALQALTEAARHQTEQALRALQQALRAAAPAGYMYLFVSAGPPMQQLLDQLAKHLPATGNNDALRAYLEQLRGAFPAAATRPVAGGGVSLLAANQLVEPLSEREVEVLQLIAAGMSNQEIADALVVALSTVKKHINNIYGKLDARSRTQALLKARSLGLLA